jgi:hypothetical protein
MVRKTYNKSLCVLVSYLLLLYLPTVSASEHSVTAQYTKYDGYSAVDFDNVAGTFTPTEQDCLALATASLLANGIVYQDSSKTCKVMSNNNNLIVIKLHSNPTWTVYVKDISNRFVPVFISYAAQTSTAPVDLIGMWQTGTGATSDYATAINNCSCTYRNEYIARAWNISLVKYMNLVKLLNKSYCDLTNCNFRFTGLVSSLVYYTQINSPFQI